MNITILSNKDIASNFALNWLLPKLKQHNVHVFLSATVGGNKRKPQALMRLKECEQGFALRYISACSGENFKNFQQLNQFTQSPIIELNNINEAAGLSAVNKTNADLIISIRYGVILKDAAIACAKYGVINLHSGLLPNYRGVMATFWAMQKNDKNVGTTLHYIEDSSIDTGKVIATSTLKVQPSKSYLWHVLQLYKDGVDNIIRCVHCYQQNLNVPAIVQCRSDDYYTFPTNTDIEKFEQKNLTLFDENELIGLLNDYY